MAADFWTESNFQPMQRFRFDVQTNIFKMVSVGGPGPGIAQLDITKPFTINPAYIKAVNLPSVTFGYDNDAANIGSDGPNIESQDPTMTELELQFYMFPDLAIDIQDIFYTYYLQDLKPNGANRTTYRGILPRILSKDRISLKPSRTVVKNSSIIINIYDPGVGSPVSGTEQALTNRSAAREIIAQTLRDKANGIPGSISLAARLPSATAGIQLTSTPIRSMKYYGVYPVSYDLGTLEYGNSEILEGSMKFYFHGVETLLPNKKGKYEQIINSSFTKKGKQSMGEF